MNTSSTLASILIIIACVVSLLSFMFFFQSWAPTAFFVSSILILAGTAVVAIR